MFFSKCGNNLNSSSFQNTTIDDNDLLNGRKTVIHKKDSVYKNGDFVDGFKEGIWLYKVDSFHFEMEWGTVRYNEKLKLSKPMNWKILDTYLDAFTAKGPVMSNDSGQVVILQKNNVENKSDFTKEYYQLFKTEFEERYSILDSSSECFMNGNRKFLISKFYFKKDDKFYSCYSALCEEKNVLTEITYYFKSNNWKAHYNIFLDFVNGVKYNDNFLTDHSSENYDPWGFVSCDK